MGDVLIEAGEYFSVSFYDGVGEGVVSLCGDVFAARQMKCLGMNGTGDEIVIHLAV